MSGPPTSKGNRKLPNPPIIAGITIKNIIKMACAVIILLYSWLSAIYCTPGPDNSNLISTENAVPNNPENRANIRYNVPISFALLDKNQRSHQRDMLDSCTLESSLGENRLKILLIFVELFKKKKIKCIMQIT